MNGQQTDASLTIKREFAVRAIVWSHWLWGWLTVLPKTMMNPRNLALKWELTM